METVTFYSYKGGVGRSLILANAARFLAMSGRRVVALDLDFEAPGLHYKTGVAAAVETGAVELLTRSLDGDLPSLDELRAASVSIPLPESHGGWLRLIAAGPAPSPAYWSALAHMRERTDPSEELGLLEAMIDLQARIEEAWAPDLLLIDARTGVTSLGGIATMALSDRVVLVTTAARESIEGVRAVASALNRMPSLRGDERSLEYVVSRVQGTEGLDQSALRELLGAYFELPGDPYDGGAERMLGSDTPPPHDRRRESRDDASTILLPRTRFPSLLAKILEWTARTFPTQDKLAHHMRQRLLWVDQAWFELTSPTGHIGKWTQTRDCWAKRALDLNCSFAAKSGGDARIADIVARLANGELAMIIEYVGDAEREPIARWWADNVDPRLIVLLSDGDGYSQLRWLYRRKQGGAHDVTLADRQTLPTPAEFEVSRDPSDLSVDALLDAAPRTPIYDERLIVEWVQCSSVSLDGGTPDDPVGARRIVDGLAAIDDPKRAASLLHTCASGSSDRDLRLPSGDVQLDRLMHAGLCAPLCWRAPPEAFIDSAWDHRHGPPPVFHALRRLGAFMGLDYDPDATFRREAWALRPQGGIHDLRERFADRRLSFEWSNPPQLIETAERLPYHGHLGSYDPTRGHITAFAPTIAAVAERLGLRPRYLGSVTLLHLGVLAMLHNGIDLDLRRWDEFSLGDPAPSTETLSRATIVLTQFFVHRFILELADQALAHTFAAMSDAQAPAYGAWRAMDHVSRETARAWMLALRRGSDDSAPIDLDTLPRRS